MLNLRDLPLNTAAVPATATVGEALLAMEREDQQAVSIWHDGRLEGLLTLEGAVLHDTSTPVRDAMRSVDLEFSASDRIRQSAKTFVASKADHAAVWDGTHFLGLLSSIALIGALGQSFDPLTGLSWSDRLREWGIDSLEQGREVCIIFFDLDDFGAYNKRHGHIIGDRILTTFAAQLRARIDPATDVLVRYGGDEFVIGTWRSRGDVRHWMATLAGFEIRVADLDDPVRFSVGVSGGMRGQERTRDHTAAMLDNLINLASKDCMRNKAGHGSLDDSAESRVDGIRIWPDPPYEIEVELTINGRPGKARGLKGEQSGLTKLAKIAALALESAYPGIVVTIDDTLIHLDADAHRAISAIGSVQIGSTAVVISATTPIGDDLNRALVEAILAAFQSVDHRLLAQAGSTSGRPQLL